MRVLTRSCAREAETWFLVYATGYLGLTALAFSIPMIERGAPIEAVLLFLPNQLLFFGIVAMPLAMVTAMLATIGRMREDGEIVALMAGGIGSWAVCRALLRLAVLLAILLSCAVHFLLPPAMQRLYEGKTDLLRQGVATQVARKALLVDEKDLIVAALGVEGNELQNVFARRDLGRGRSLYCFAPQALWHTDASAEPLALDLHDPMIMHLEPRSEGPPRMTTALIKDWSLRVPSKRENFSSRPETMSTLQVIHALATITPATRNRRDLQITLQQRFLLPLATFAFWTFACGVGLSIGRANRLLAICLGLITVIGAIVPPMMFASSLDERLPFHPAWLLWPPVVAVAAIGVGLMWKHR